MNRRPISVAASAFFSLSLGCQVLVGQTSNSDRKVQNTMARTNQLFEVLKAIYSKRPFRPETISASTATSMHLQTTPSNPYFQIYEGAGKPHGLFTAVEARLPTSSARAKDGLVTLRVNTSEHCIN